MNQSPFYLIDLALVAKLIPTFPNQSGHHKWKLKAESGRLVIFMKNNFHWFHHGIWNKKTLASIWLTRKTQPILEVRRELGASSRGNYKGLVFMHWRRHEIADAGRKHCYLNPRWAAWSTAWDPLGRSKIQAKIRGDQPLLCGGPGVRGTCRGSRAGKFKVIF